jgi:hypothetical protein
MNEGTTAKARTPLKYLHDMQRQRFGQDILRQEGSGSMSRVGQEGGQTIELRTESQKERRRRTGKAPMEAEPAPRDEIF